MTEATFIASNRKEYFCLYHSQTALCIAGSLSALYGGYLIQSDTINVKTLFSVSLGLAICTMTSQVLKQIIGLLGRTLFLVFLYNLLLCVASILIVKFAKDNETKEWLVLGAYLAILVFMLASESIQFCRNKTKFPVFDEEIQNQCDIRLDVGRTFSEFLL